jgi:hypothetical protein
MAKPFKGVINVDVTESVPDWSPPKVGRRDASVL